jgi:predicted acyltransferase
MAEKTDSMAGLPDAPQPIVIESPLQGDLDRLDDTPEVVTVETHQSAAPHAVPHTNPRDVSVVSDAPAEVAAPRDRRALSLDALRGLLLVSMTLGFSIASDKLPGWMYHRQYPGGETFVNIAGLTWRDIAYCGFLFTMSAALPLTLSRRMAKGEKDVGILLAILRRGFLLIVFALLVGHSNTYFTGYTQTARALAIAGFVIMALVFTRRRSDWNPAKFRVFNLLGWAAAFVFLLFSPMLYGKGLDINRIDDIIVGLAFAAMVGSIVWYLTRDNINMRLGFLALCMAGYLGAKGDGWVADWWWADNFPFFHLGQLTLMAVVIPGTIAGDHLLKWMRSSREEQSVLLFWSNARVLGLAFVCALMTPIVVVGLYNRWVPETTEIILGLIVGGGVLVWNPTTESEKLIRRVFVWSALWLMTGLILEPFEGGIHKVPDTLSYFFTVTGLVGMLLVGFIAVVDLLQRRKWVNALIDVGHNPLLCYVLFTVFLNSIFEMIPPMRNVLTATPEITLIRSAISTLLVVLIVRWTSRKRIFWRT